MILRVVTNMFHNLQIKYKLLLLYFLVTIVPVSAIAYFSYSSSISSLEKESLNLIRQFQQNTITTVNNRLDSYLFLANSIYDNQRIQNFVLGKYINSYEEYDTVVGFLDPVLQSLLKATGKGICVMLVRYNDKGGEILQANFENILGFGKQYNDYLGRKAQFYQVINYSRIKDKDWFKEIKGKTPNYTWKQVNEDSKYSYMSLIREMSDYSSHSAEKIGLLRLTVRLADIIGEEVVNDVSVNGFNMFFDENNRLLSLEKEKSVFFDENSDVILDLLAEESGSSIILKDYILIVGDIYTSNWKIVSVFPTSNLTTNIRHIGSMTIIYCLISLIFLFFVTFFLSTYFSRRINNITRQMQKFRMGDFDARVHEVNKDELGFLATVFNDMTAYIKSLIIDNLQANIEKKDAQLKALQAQINPHFLYNSLSAICRLAEIGYTADIIKMVKALSKFYRLTLSKGRDIISISDEIEQIKAYIDVFSIRKGEYFRVNYHIDEGVLGFYTPKVIIQPFVENIFEHAMPAEEKVINIDIAVTQKEGNIEFRIADDGVGIPADRLERILSCPKKSGNNGYGIWNVDERIRLQFGEEYGVKIQSAPGKGTTVTLTIPRYVPPGQLDKNIYSSKI